MLAQTLHVWYIRLYIHWGGTSGGQWISSPMAVPNRSCLGMLGIVQLGIEGLPESGGLELKLDRF